MFHVLGCLGFKCGKLQAVGLGRSLTDPGALSTFPSPGASADVDPAILEWGPTVQDMLEVCTHYTIPAIIFPVSCVSSQLWNR